MKCTSQKAFESRKMRTRTTSNTDTIYAVMGCESKMNNFGGISNVSKVIRKCFESFLPKFDCLPLLGDQSACGNSTDIFRNNVKGKSKTMYTLYIKGRKYLNQRTDYIQLFYQVQVSL